MRGLQYLAVLLLILTSCKTTAVTPAPMSCSAGETLNVVDTLFFGAGEDFKTVPEREWKNFIDTVVTPAFPNGLTYLRGDGQWRNGRGTIDKESSYVLVIVHDPSNEADGAIARLASTYDRRFNQESVLRVRSWACRSFLEK